MADKFTERQAKFIELYEGNGTQAAKDAGYKGSDNALGKTAHDLLRNPKIAEAIKNRQKKVLDGIIATREERQIWWTAIMMNEKKEMKDRIKASELLGKSEADFTEKLDVNLKEDLAKRVAAARARKQKK